MLAPEPFPCNAGGHAVIYGEPSYLSSSAREAPACRVATSPLRIGGSMTFISGNQLH